MDTLHRTPSGILGELSSSERSVEERLRTLAMCTCALGVVGASLYWLRTVLVPFVLANALQQMLVPLVELLVMIRICGCFHMPRFIAVLITIFVAAAFLSGIGLVVADSVREFSARASEYTTHVQRLVEALFHLMDRYGFDSSVRLTKLKELGDKLPITSILMMIIESLASTVADLFLILLFTLYLLLAPSSSSGDDSPPGAGVIAEADLSALVDAQIRRFIKGKVLLSLLVGVLTGLLLRMVGVDLWLGFGVIAFWLNFIPNVGALIAVAAPMPLVLFNPGMNAFSMMMALLLPLAVHLIVGNMLEPIVFGRAMELQPVTVLLSLMLWGTLWGVPGLILAVPLTAVLKIHLQHIDHPLPRMILRLLDGRHRRPGSLPRNLSAEKVKGRSVNEKAVKRESLDEDEEEEELLPMHNELREEPSPRRAV